MKLKSSYTTPSKSIKIPQIRLSWIHLIAVVLAFLYIQSCSSKRDLLGELSQIDKVKNDTIQYYKNKQGEYVASKLSYEGEKASYKAFLSAARDSTEQFKNLANYYKSVSAGIKTKTITVIDSIEVPYTVTGDAFDIPFNKQTKFYSLSGRSTNNGLFLDNFTMPNSQSIVIGKKKSGFFRTDFRIDVVNSNPYIKTTEVDSYVHSEPKKRFGIGAFVGYGVSKDGFSPVIGVGFTADVIRF